MLSPFTLVVVLAVLLVVADLFWMWRKVALGQLDRAWSSLMLESAGGAPLEEEQLAGLPAPVRRFVRAASGHRETDDGRPVGVARRYGRLELRMRGQFVGRPGDEPLALTMHELLVPGRGFVWRAEGSVMGLRFDGGDMYLDAKAQMRFFLGFIVPFVQVSGGEVVGSARGRLFAESILLPSMLLPERGVAWSEAPDADEEGAPGSAWRAEATIDGEMLEMVVRLGEDGFPWAVDIARWRDALGGRPAGVAPFRARLDGWRWFGEVMLPERIRAQWTDLPAGGPTDDSCFTFLDARVTAATAI